MRRVKKKNKIKLPSRSEKVPPFPKLLHGAPSSSPPPLFPIDLPRPRSKFDKYPRLIRVGRAVKSLLKVEPDKPIRMPSFPTLSFPRLYTRYSIMKTYTAITDVNGKITVTFPRVFRKAPGVVISPKDAGTWFEHVISTNEFGFTLQILKTLHSHGASSGGGGSHAHVIQVAGDHYHDVGGTLAYSVDYDFGVKIAAVALAGGHDHTNPNTGGPSTSITLVHTINTGTACADGWCVTGFLGGDAAGVSHVHAQGNTSAEPDHVHVLVTTFRNYVVDVNIDNIIAWTTSQHDGHDHPEDVNGYHLHSILDDEPSPLFNTSVTFTYFAQEETP